MSRVPFDREAYNQNNQLGIKVALEMLNQHGFVTIENGDIEQYCARDCLVRKNNRDVPIEVERKLVWSRKDDWEGYPNVRVPYRKINSGAELYVMINQPSTCMIVCKMKDVKSSPTTLYTTQKYGVEEKFFSVSIDKFDVFVLCGTEWVVKKSKGNLLDYIGERHVPIATGPLDAWRGSFKKLPVL